MEYGREVTKPIMGYLSWTLALLEWQRYPCYNEPLPDSHGQSKADLNPMVACSQVEDAQWMQSVGIYSGLFGPAGDEACSQF